MTNEQLTIAIVELLDIIEEMQEYNNCKISTNQKLKDLRKIIIRETKDVV